MAKTKLDETRTKLEDKTHKEILAEIRDLKEDTEESVKIQYGLREFFQGLMIGVILGFILAWVLFKYV